MRDTAFVLTWNNIPTTTARSRLVPSSPMRLAMGSFPPRPLHLRPRHVLTGCVRPRAAMTTPDPMTTPDVMGFGACYLGRPDSRHAPVIIAQSGDNRLWSYHNKVPQKKIPRARGSSRPCPEN